MNKLAVCLLAMTCVFLGSIAAPAQHKPAVGELFVAVSGADYIEVIDPRTHQVVDKITVGKQPNGLYAGEAVRLLDQLDQSVYVTIEGENRLVHIDALHHRIIKQSKVGKKPGQLCVSRGTAFVPLQAEASIAVVTLTAGIQTALGPRHGPYVEWSHRVIKRIPVGLSPRKCYAGQTTGRVYAISSAEKKIYAIDPEKLEVLYTVDLPGEPVEIILSKDERRAYVSLVQLRGFLVVDMQQRSVTQRIEFPSPPDTAKKLRHGVYMNAMALSLDGGQLWVASCPDGALYLYDVCDLKFLDRITTGPCPDSLAWQPVSQFMSPGEASAEILWVSDSEANQVSALDPARRKVLVTIPTGPRPTRIVFVPPPSSH